MARLSHARLAPVSRFSRLRRGRSPDATGPGSVPSEPPFPPQEMRALVGSTDKTLFDNPTGGPVFPGMAPEDFPTILDFGCGCGRLARQFLQQQPRPERYVGLDLHAGMISVVQPRISPRWPPVSSSTTTTCSTAPSTRAPTSPCIGRWSLAARPSRSSSRSRSSLISTQDQTEVYLSELAGTVGPTGTLLTSWFLFDKRDFPMMQETQNTLFINEHDVRNAVIYDWSWLRRTSRSAAGPAPAQWHPRCAGTSGCSACATPGRT